MIKTTQIDGDVSVGRNVALGGDAHIAGSTTIAHDLEVEGWLNAPNVKATNKGIFTTLSKLETAYPSPEDGWFAGVGTSTPFAAYVAEDGEWVATGGTIDVEVDIDEIDDRLDALESDVEGAETAISGLDTRLDAAEDDIDTLEDKVDNSYIAGSPFRHFSIVAGKARVIANSFALHDSDIRCTISNVLGVKDLANAKMMVSPQGYQIGFVQAKALQSDTECLDTGWKGGSYEISDLLDDEYPYKIFNFRRADNTTISQQDSETIANECLLVFEPQSAIDFIDENGSIAKSVFNDNDTEKVEVYTKDAVDGMVGNSYTAGVSRLTFAIEVGKQRVPAYGFSITDNSTRCTISSILTTEDLAYAKRMVSPQGYQANFVQAKALSKNADNISTNWKGGSFSIEDVLSDEYPYKLFNFRRTDGDDVDDTDGTTIAEGFYVEIEAPSAIDFIDKNGSIAKSVVNANDTEKVEVYTKDAVDMLLNHQAVGFATKGDGSMTYAGAPINLSRNTFVKVPLSTLMTDGGKGRQGGAVFGNYFFQFHIGNSYIQVYSLGADINLEQTITLTENVNNHANAGGFGAKYDESDPFPLLYIASSDEYRVYVYRLTGALPNLSIQLHQTITLPSATDLVYIPSVAIDTVSNELVIYGYTRNTWSDGTNNKSVVAYYDIPPTLGDQTISVSDEKARYYLPYVYAMQGACVNNGKLYLLWGNAATTQGGGLIVFNKGVIESSLDFAAVGQYEPEAVGIYDDALYVSTQQRRMVKLTF